ncbi:hypothetical protein SDC9_194522 [bioreactor metagenome]|uniref:Putative nitroreductase TM1586 domain-containing protein n=1 Tax=bioreactor metagenome TaxID=1076179 RepID=A0A645IHV2_9ZZZZ
MEFKRKPSDAVWQGAMRSEVMEAVRLAPSATNSQPWRFTVDDHRLTVFRDTAALSIIPPSRKPFFNTIDVGISLCFLELALTHAGLHFERTITKPSRGGRLEELAVYQLDQ